MIGERAVVQIREIDREVIWKLQGKVYVKTTILTERIPQDEVPTCLWCGDPMFEAREGQLYCRDQHRKAHWKRKQEQRDANGRGRAS